MNYRYDSVKIEDFKFTPTGFLNISGIVTRTGVFKYAEGNELRVEEEVFKQDSLDTLFGIPVTWEHPSGETMVTMDNSNRFQKGIVASEPTRVVGKSIHSLMKLDRILITDKLLIEEIILGKIKELSLAYTRKLDETPGVFDGIPYIGIQRDISYNHLAVVSRARCGARCSIVKDGETMVEGKKDSCTCGASKKEDSSDLSQSVIEKLKSLETRLDALNSSNQTTLHDRLEKLTAVLEKNIKADKKDEDEEGMKKKKKSEEEEEGEEKEDEDDEDEEEEMKKKKDKGKKDSRGFNFSFKEDSSSVEVFNPNLYFHQLVTKGGRS
jgi:hypothetical protein